MSNKSIGFVGGGRVTRIFLEGWKRANALPANIVVSDCNAASLAKLKTQFPGIQGPAPRSPGPAEQCSCRVVCTGAARFRR